MSLSLTCACGARFEVDESYAGREIACPDCQQKIQVPGLTGPAPARRPSTWALASMNLALLGAFTVVGTAAAVVCGVVALVRIRRQPDHVGGAGYAAFGIGAGAVFTALTLFALNGDLFGLGDYLRANQFADQLDFSGPDEVARPAQGFTLTRPTPQWGVAHNNTLDHPPVANLLGSPDLILVQPRRGLFVDVRRPPGTFRELDGLQDYVLDELRLGPPGRRDRHDSARVTALVKNSRELPRGDAGLTREVDLEVTAGQPWVMVARLHLLDNGRAYVVRAYAPQRRFKDAANEAELRKALDSFKVLP